MEKEMIIFGIAIVILAILMVGCIINGNSLNRTCIEKGGIMIEGYGDYICVEKNDLNIIEYGM